MKKLLKISSYTLATIIAFVMSQGTVLAAGNATDNAGLSGGQVVGGLSIIACYPGSNYQESKKSCLIYIVKFCFIQGCLTAERLVFDQPLFFVFFSDSSCPITYNFDSSSFHNKL
jgi:hypothetical protein